MDPEICRQIIHRHLDVLAVIYMMIRVQMMLLHSKSLLLLILARQFDLAGCIIHIQFWFQPVCRGIALRQFDRKPVFRIDIGPVRIGIGEPFSTLCFHAEITHSQETPKSIRPGRSGDFFSQIRIAVHDHLPCG